jgi:glutamate racemase
MIAAAQGARERPRISNFVGGGLADARRSGGPAL